ncbi:MAG: TIGR03617 family F420-dependent LLM class oxidoreductase [Rhodocyclaceae bacterium]|nr:TIGR03617 family F420-dependent LLM class oxidoreductase [Rhodocyclaceae bacterium]MBK6553342.1 TIGR03617 family F420-dependent LLM class oxidoreductase [Rhodocyclaceae bacterium]MBK9311489.1 TIGR03617 family F420-dependent LLM class oxidoreductase [Rhodocyclaceae bacterium]MBK9956328.1 TIGR03617 family F420-dependent LLM class oxidoreductase [Rhodocyclaceae bacterium]
MRVETALFGPDTDQYAGSGQSRPTLASIAASAREAEALGFDGLTSAEAGHDPFIPLAVAAEHTRAITLGTNVAIAFPRSPMATAQAAWDLQNLSGGRFTLGLGTQVKGHNERRYSTPWPSPPGPRMREYFQCLRAIFSSFQNPAKPSYFEGQHYRFTLLPPFFNPGPIEHPQVPLYAAAANPFMAQLAGEICEGLRLHPISTFRYTREVILPAVAVGAERGGRNPASFDLIGAPFMALGRDQAQLEAAKNALRKQIAFYASTRSYHGVLAHHGWEDIGLELHRLSVAGEWNRMPALITDDMLDEWAVVTTYDRLADTLRSRCAGLFATVVLVLLGEARQDTDLLRETVRRLHED